MIEISRMEQPPTRLYLGGDALRGIEYKLQDVARSVEQYQRLSLSTGFDR